MLDVIDWMTAGPQRPPVCKLVKEKKTGGGKLPQIIDSAFNFFASSDTQKIHTINKYWNENCKQKLRKSYQITTSL